MARYTQMIAGFEAERNAKLARLREAVARRDASPRDRAAWKQAAAEFAQFDSQVGDMLRRCVTEGLTDDPDLRAFAIDHVAADPYYFRSGYIMEMLLRRIKKLKLTAPEQMVIQRVIVARIDQGARREFRHLCRLIPRIADPEFRAQVDLRARSADATLRHRATFAQRYFP